MYRETFLPLKDVESSLDKALMEWFDNNSFYGIIEKKCRNIEV